MTSFNEICNKEIVDILANITYKQFIEIIKTTEWGFETEDVSMEENYEQQYYIIKTYCNEIKKNNYSLKVSYQESPKQIGGRVYAKNGIQNIWGIFRGAICHEKYYDFDMRQAHHQILF